MTDYQRAEMRREEVTEILDAAAFDAELLEDIDRAQCDASWPQPQPLPDAATVVVTELTTISGVLDPYLPELPLVLSDPPISPLYPNF